MKYSRLDKAKDLIYFLRQMSQFIKLLSTYHHNVTGPETRTSGTDQDKDSIEKLFNKYGTDKSTHHDYHRIYDSLLPMEPFNLKTIIEIGIGSNNVEVPQNMGVDGVPGASLRAFRDWAPNAQVIGADIDHAIMFEEERIRTYYVDQLDRQTIAEFFRTINQPVQLLVVDGLHTPRADLNTVLAAIPYMDGHSLIVVEDISPKAKWLWQLAKIGTRKIATTTLLKMKNGNVFLIYF
jgi:hypothetical protein